METVSQNKKWPAIASSVDALCDAQLRYRATSLMRIRPIRPPKRRERFVVEAGFALRLSSIELMTKWPIQKPAAESANPPPAKKKGWGFWQRRQCPVPTWRGWLLIALV